MANAPKRSKKLKPLLDDVPPGYLVDAAWLVARDIDRKSIHDYAKRGWLEPVVRGVYRRPPAPDQPRDGSGDALTTVRSLQHLLRYDVHVGGRTALSLRGYAHQVNVGTRPALFLYGSRFPTWLKRLPDGGSFVSRKDKLFDGPAGLGVEPIENLNATAPAGWQLLGSTPERAILELLDELPKRESFDTVDAIFEGLVSLRPDQLRALLLSCQSVKVKRLFFVFADRHAHQWRRHLESSEFNLGSGPRALVEGGKLHPVYQLTVPMKHLPLSAKEDEDGP